MSVLSKALKTANLTLEADTLPKKQRTVKTFQRLIAAVRAAEGDFLDALSLSERQLNECLQEKQVLQDENHELRTELMRLKLAERLENIQTLTTADRTKLLEVASA